MLNAMFTQTESTNEGNIHTSQRNSLGIWHTYLSEFSKVPLKPIFWYGVSLSFRLVLDQFEVG